MEIKGKKEEPYYPDGGYGWIIVIAIILINVTLLTLLPCFGLIFRDEFHEWGVTAAQTSFLLHLHSSLYCCFGFFTSPFLKLYGMKLTGFVGAGMMCLGILLTSFGTSYVYLIFSASVLIGVGQGIVMPATYLATYTYFKKRLTIAVSLTVTSASLSSIVLPKICDWLLNRIGRRNTVLLLFIVSLLSFVGCALLKPVKKPQPKEVEEESEKEACINETKVPVKKHETGNEDATNELLQKEKQVLQDIIYKDTTVPAKSQTLWRKIFNIFDLHLLQDVPLVMIIIGLGLSFAAELNIILLLQFLLRDLSLFERSDVATAVSIQGITDIVGRLVIPILGHGLKISAKSMYVGALVLASAARTALSLWPTTKLAVFGVVAVIGLTKGTRAVFQSVILPKYVSLDKIPAANGINMFFTGFVSLLIGPLLGVVHDKSGSYLYVLHAASAISFLSVILWLFEWVFWKKFSEKTDDSR